MKISGVSLTPAATPVAIPVHQRPVPWPSVPVPTRPMCRLTAGRRSQMIAAISSRLIWPRPKLDCTGWVHRATAATASTHPVRARPAGTPMLVSVIQIATTSAAELAAVSPQASTGRLRYDIAAKLAAANGGELEGVVPCGDTPAVSCVRGAELEGEACLPISPAARERPTW